MIVDRVVRLSELACQNYHRMRYDAGNACMQSLAKLFDRHLGLQAIWLALNFVRKLGNGFLSKCEQCVIRLSRYNYLDEFDIALGECLGVL